MKLVEEIRQRSRRLVTTIVSICWRLRSYKGRHLTGIYKVLDESNDSGSQILEQSGAKLVMQLKISLVFYARSLKEHSSERYQIIVLSNLVGICHIA